MPSFAQTLVVLLVGASAFASPIYVVTRESDMAGLRIKWGLSTRSTAGCANNMNCVRDAPPAAVDDSVGVAAAADDAPAAPVEKRTEGPTAPADEQGGEEPAAAADDASASIKKKRVNVPVVGPIASADTGPVGPAAAADDAPAVPVEKKRTDDVDGPTAPADELGGDAPAAAADDISAVVEVD